MLEEHMKKVISLFSGAGGMDIGFEKAGFKIAVAVEIDTACCETLLRNRPDLTIINENIETVTTQKILDAANIKPLEAALVIGGPPCQPFSLAGQRKGLSDSRGKLLFEFARVVRESLPSGFVLENVKGLQNWDSGKALNLLIDELKKPIVFNGVTYQYDISEPQVLNAVNFGVPQNRERIIIVGNRLGLKFKYPELQYGKYPLQPPKTVWDALKGLPPAHPPSDVALRVSQTIKGRREKHGF